MNKEWPQTQKRRNGEWFSNIFASLLWTRLLKLSMETVSTTFSNREALWSSFQTSVSNVASSSSSSRPLQEPKKVKIERKYRFAGEQVVLVFFCFLCVFFQCLLCLFHLQWGRWSSWGLARSKEVASVERTSYRIIKWCTIWGLHSDAFSTSYGFVWPIFISHSNVKLSNTNIYFSIYKATSTKTWTSQTKSIFGFPTRFL